MRLACLGMASPAIANFSCAIYSIVCGPFSRVAVIRKSVLARRQNQHARRVRYPYNHCM